jgi:hypothetical protein
MTRNCSHFSFSHSLSHSPSRSVSLPKSISLPVSAKINNSTVTLQVELVSLDASFFPVGQSHFFQIIFAVMHPVFD